MEKIKQVISKGKWVPIILAVLVLSVVMSFVTDNFATLGNFGNILEQASVTGIMAVGMTFIILTGGIDISVGGILFITGSIFVEGVKAGYNVLLVGILVVILAAALGALNGYLIVKTKMMPFIVTLATYNVYRGLALHITEAKDLVVPDHAKALGTMKIFEFVPLPSILFIIAIITGLYLANRTKFGIYVKAIGNSEKSAIDSGLPVVSTMVRAYMLGGLTAGISGLILIGRIGLLQSGLGAGMEFTVIASVVLGGTALSGGSGSVIGSSIGAIFLLLITNGLNLMEVSPFVYEVVTGGILLVAVILDRVSSVRQSKAMQAQKAKRIRNQA